MIVSNNPFLFVALCQYYHRSVLRCCWTKFRQFVSKGEYLHLFMINHPTENDKMNCIQLWLSWELTSTATARTPSKRKKKYIIYIYLYIYVCVCVCVCIRRLNCHKKEIRRCLLSWKKLKGSETNSATSYLYAWVFFAAGNHCSAYQQYSWTTCEARVIFKRCSFKTINFRR
mgnify:CR=1 FL=1